jgi:hypothetical protein
MIKIKKQKYQFNIKYQNHKSKMDTSNTQIHDHSLYY